LVLGGPEYFDEIRVDPVSVHIGRGVGDGGWSRGSAKSGVKIFVTFTPYNFGTPYPK